MQKGESIRTTGDAHVELMMQDGHQLIVAPAAEVRLDDNLAESEQRPTAQDSAVASPATAQTIIETLATGGDLSQQLEATAAGLGGGGADAADGGVSFVQLLRITEGVEPLSYAYNFNLADVPPALQGLPENAIATTVTLTADGAVFEGSKGVTYTASLGLPAQSDMTINLSNGGVIFIPKGSTTGTVLSPVQGDDVYRDGETLQVHIDSVQGGGFTPLTVNDANVVTVVNDTTDIPVIVSVSVVDGEGSGEGTQVVEGNALTFRFSVDYVPQTELTLQVTIGGVVHSVTIAPGTFYTDVTVPSRPDDIYAQGSSTVTAAVTGFSPTADGNFEKLDFSGATASALVVDNADTTTVSLSATASITEAQDSITYTATLTHPADVGAPVTVTLSNGETITIAAGASTGTVAHTVTPNEDVYLDPTSVSATITTVSGGNFENLVVDATAAVTQISDTIDTTTVTLGDATVNEGVSYTLQASITSGPIDGPLVLTLSNGATVTFTVGGPLTVTSTAVAATNVPDGGGTLPVSVTSHSGGSEFENLVLTDTGTVTIHDSTPTAGTVAATVDDEGLLGGIPGGMGDYTDTNADGDNNEATFSGTLIHDFGGDSAGGSISFAAMNGTTGSVGTETVSYAWNGTTHTLTATGPRGDLFTVRVDPASGAYTVTLVDNVLHASGLDENNAGPVALSYTVVDGDNSTATGTLNITFNDDVPTFTQIIQGMASNQAGDLVGTHNMAFGADGEGSINIAGLTTVAGLNYSAAVHNADGSTTLAAGTGSSTTGFFALTINPDGTYDFHLSDPRPSLAKTVTFPDVSGGAGVPSLTIGSGSNAITFEGLGGDTIKPTSAGFGVNNGNLDPGDDFKVTFAGNQIDSVSFALKHQGSGAFEMSWTTNTGETGTVSTLTDATLTVDPTNDFTSITFQTTSGSAKMDTFSYSQNLFPPD